MKLRAGLITICMILLLIPRAEIFDEGPKINVDSLQQILPALKSTARIDALNKLSMALCAQYPDSTIALTHQAIKLSDSLLYRKGLADGYFNLGNGYYFKDDFKNSIVNYLKALRIYEDLPPSKEFADLCKQLGAINIFSGRYNEASEYFKKAKENYRLAREETSEVEATIIVIDINLELREWDTAFHYMSKLLSDPVVTENNNNRGFIYNEAGLIYLYQFVDSGDTSFLSQAVPWFKKGLEIQNIKTPLKANLNFNLGSSYFRYKTDKYLPHALRHLQEAYNISDSCNCAYQHLAMVNHFWGLNSRNKGEYDKAIFYFKKGISFIENILRDFPVGNFDNLIFAYYNKYHLKLYKQILYNDLYETYLGISKYEKALEYYIASKQAEQDIFKETNQNLLTFLDANFQDEKVQSQISALAKENEMKDLKLNQSKLILYGLAGLIMIVFLVGILFIRQNRLKSEHRTVVLEQKLLRLQMNPHFIFNALSNIMSFIEENKNNSAISYLSRFSKLLRTTLESSREDNILLDQEIEGLQNYLELQKLRYEDKFEYTIEVDINLDPEEVTVPPMLIQPFVENAIEHGIRHMRTTGNINVRFILNEKKLHCEVEDDGVGREKAMETENQASIGHKSLATEIVRDRIQAINRKMKQKINLEIIDLKSESMKPLGTKVVIELPYKPDLID